MDYLLKSADILEQVPFSQSVSFFNIGSIYLKLEIYTKAIEYFKKSYDVSKTGKNVNIENASLMALGASYLNLKKLYSARIFLEMSLEISKKTNSSLGYYQTYNKLGGLYDKMKLFNKAEKAHLDSKKYAYLLNDEMKIMSSISSLASHYYLRKNYKKASILFKEFDVLYKKNPRIDEGVGAFKIWAKAEGYLGNVEKSGDLLNKYLSIKDSIYSKESKQIISDAESKYQTEKKDKEIAEQNLKLVEHEKEIQKKNTQYTYMTGAALLLFVGLTSLWFIYQQRQKRKNQEILTLKREQQVQTLESLMEGEEKERLRISKELHDGVNVDLSAIKYKLTSMLEKNNQVINEVVTMIDKSCEQVRAISHNLVPPSLKDFSLVETIEDFCTTTNSIHKPEITFTHIGEAVAISKKAEVNIFRIVQELVNNSLKHAEATEINVQLSNHNNNIQLTVEDNGKGFNKEEIKSNGIGLQNIQSRVDYLAAKLDFSSNEKGTSYIIDINTESLS